MKNRKRICVLGLGLFGHELAVVLTKDCEVMAIDINQKVIDDIAQHVQRALCLDVRNYSALSEVVNDEFDEAVVCMSESLEASVLSVLHLKRLGVPQIQAKAHNPDHAEILKALGATRVIFPERETAQRLAARILNPNLLDFVPLADNYRVMEVVPPKSFHGHTLEELDIRRRFGVLPIAVIEQDGKHPVFLLGADFVLKSGEILLVVGEEDGLTALKNAAESSD